MKIIVIFLIIIFTIGALCLLFDTVIKRVKAREQAKTVREEKVRRDRFIKEITDISTQIDNDPQCKELFRFLDEIIVPQASNLSTIGFNGYCVEIRTSERGISQFASNKNNTLNVDVDRFGLSLSSDKRKIAFVYSLKKRYPFTKYRIQKPNMSSIDSSDLEAAYFDSGDEYGHGSALFLCGPSWGSIYNP